MSVLGLDVGSVRGDSIAKCAARFSAESVLGEPAKRGVADVAGGLVRGRVRARPR